MLKLIDYPAAIATQEHNLLTVEQNIRQVKEQILNLNNQFDYAIAFDADLKNDLQRKAKRSELMNSDDYRAAVGRLQRAEDVHAAMSIELTLLRNEFSVLKLQLREVIASTERLAEAA